MSATIFRRAVLKWSPAGRKQSLSPVCPRRLAARTVTIRSFSCSAARPFTHHVLVRPTGFRARAETNQDPRAEFHQLYEALRNDEKRNQMIYGDVVGAVGEGQSPLVLTERIEQLQSLYK